MAAPLTKENREKIVDYLKSLDLSNLTGFQIKELIKKDLKISISQPTTSKLKADVLEDNSGDGIEDSSSLEHPMLSEEIGAIDESIKPDKIRQLSQGQMNTIERLLQGQSDRAVAEAVGVSRQTIWEWRNQDPLFTAELNRQRIELWSEGCKRLKALANRAIDTLEQQLGSEDPKIALAAAKYVLQSTQLLGDTDLPINGPTTPEEVLMKDLRSEARRELAAKKKQDESRYSMFDQYEHNNFENEVEALARSKLKDALAREGLS